MMNGFAVNLESPIDVERISKDEMKIRFPNLIFPAFTSNNQDAIAFLRDNEALDWIRLLAEHATDGRGVLLQGLRQSFFIPACQLVVSRNERETLFSQRSDFFESSVRTFLNSDIFECLNNQQVVILMTSYSEARRASLLLKRPSLPSSVFSLKCAWYDQESERIEFFVEERELQPQ